MLDAALLRMPKVGFLAPNDPMWMSTLDAMGSELVTDSLVYRYDPEAAVESALRRRETAREQLFSRPSGTGG